MNTYLPYIPQAASSLLFCAGFVSRFRSGSHLWHASALINLGSAVLILARCIADGGLWPNAWLLLLTWGNLAFVRLGFIEQSSRHKASAVLLDATQMVMLMTAASACDQIGPRAANAALITALTLHVTSAVASFVMPEAYCVITAYEGIPFLAFAGVVSAYVVWESPCYTPILPFIGGFYFPMTDVAWVIVSIAIACSPSIYCVLSQDEPNDLAPWWPSVLMGLTFSLLGDTAISMSLAVATLLMMRSIGQSWQRCVSTFFWSMFVTIVTSLFAPNSALSWHIWAVGPPDSFPSLNQRLTVAATFSGDPLIGCGIGRLSTEMLEAPRGLARSVSQAGGTYGFLGLGTITLACLAALDAGTREILSEPRSPKASGCLCVMMGIEMALSLLAATGALPNLSSRGVPFAGVGGYVIPLLQAVCISFSVVFDSFVSEVISSLTKQCLPPARTSGETRIDQSAT